MQQLHRWEKNGKRKEREERNKEGAEGQGKSDDDVFAQNRKQEMVAFMDC